MGDARPFTTKRRSLNREHFQAVLKSKPLRRVACYPFRVCRPGVENWQDHWVPSYFPLVGGVKVSAGDTVRLKVTHSELNIMFEVLGVDAIAQQEEGKEEKQMGSEVGNANSGACSLVRQRLFANSKGSLDHVCPCAVAYACGRRHLPTRTIFRLFFGVGSVSCWRL